MEFRDYYLTDEQRKLVEENMSLVRFAIKKYTCSTPFEYDDMVSIGYIGLCKAAAKFNVAKNHTFSTYATKVICRTIWREVQYSTRQKRGGLEVPMSLNLSSRYDEDEELVDILVNKNTDVEFDAINKAICADLWNIVPTYVSMENNGMTGKEYAEMLGVSNTTITERRKREFEAARKYLFSKGIVSAA